MDNPFLVITPVNIMLNPPNFSQNEIVRKLQSSMNRTLLWMVAVMIFCGAGKCRAGVNADAQTILKGAGRDQGLCLVLGCGSPTKPSLLVDIANASKMLVNGIAFDNDSLLRVSSAIDSAGLQGRCAAETIPLSPLPYVPDLANLVVIEDPVALKAHGVTLDDVLKITAPGGVICTLEGGQWRVRVKPRPVGMADWMLPTGSAGGNRVSSDSLAAFPAGLRWLDDVPMNFIGGGWAACRAVVTAGGRFFTLSPTEFENLDPLNSKFKTDYWLTAHDAFNGLPLWKINCGVEAKGAALNIGDSGTLATDGTCVYTYTKEGVIAVENSTGHILRTMPVKFPTVHLILQDGVLVSVGWDGIQVSGPTGGLWAPWMPKTKGGSVQAFDVKTGGLLWEKSTVPQEILADKGMAFLLTTGSNVTENQGPESSGSNAADIRGVEAINLHTGKSLWKIGAAEFEKDQFTNLGLAAEGVLVICHQMPGPDIRQPLGSISVYSTDDGHKLWDLPSTQVTGIGHSIQMIMVQGHLWAYGMAYNLKTGQPMMDSKTGRPMRGLPYIGVGGCVPCTAVDDGRIFIQGRGFSGSIRDEASQPGQVSYRSFSYKGARGHCVQGVVAANGMFYTAQNNCRCTPDSLPGLVGFGPGQSNPTDADFQAARPMEKGPAFSVAMSETEGSGDWPMFLGDETRSNISKEKLPEGFNILWKQTVAADLSGPLANAWASRLRSTLTAPVVAGNVVVTAAIEEGRVVALNAVNGSVLWRFNAGARIESAPTLYHGRCFFGSRNGWLYALDLATGKLAWRLRVAPQERRMVAFGQVESVWPALGSVLAHNGIIYATAGLNSETDGGLTVLAADAKTGKQIWAKRIGEGFVRSNDLLQFIDGAVVLRDCRMNPDTGEGAVPQRTDNSKLTGLEGLMDEGWTKVFQRRSGFAYGPKLTGNLLLTGSDTVYGPDFAMKKEMADNLTPEQVKEVSSFLWKKPGLETRPHALALTSNALVIAGKTIRKEGVDGFVQLVNPADGATLSQTALPAPVIHQGIAIARGVVFASLSDGSVVCLSGKP